jgi:hypothetical protein
MLADSSISWAGVSKAKPQRAARPAIGARTHARRPATARGVESVGGGAAYWLGWLAGTVWDPDRGSLARVEEELAGAGAVAGIRQ